MTTIPDDIRLRPLEANDYSAIARIAAATSGFSVPTKYMVWMFASMHGDLCRVALDDNGSIIGYTLGMMTSNSDIAFSWQTAVVPSHRARHVAAALVANTAQFARERLVAFARFTCAPHQLETMTNLVIAANLGTVVGSTRIQSEWGIDEIEIELKISDDPS